MKKLYPLLCVLFLIYWGCEDQTNDDNNDGDDDGTYEYEINHVDVEYE